MTSEPAQIVCVREDGRDPRTVRPMAPVGDQLKEFPKVKDWPGKDRRPRLEVWAASGARLDPKTGKPLDPPKVEPEPEPAPETEAADS